MIEASRGNKDHADFESLINSIQLACKSVSSQLHKVGVSSLLKNEHSIGVSSDGRYSSLYNIAEETFKNSLRFTGKLGVLTSTERDADGKLDQPVLLMESWNSKYAAVFDPLDGASNIDVGIVTGTIFGIYQEADNCLSDFGESVNEDSKNCLLDSLGPFDNMVASGYCMYSSSTVIVLSLGDGVHGFTLDPSIGEFVLTHPNIRIPKRGRIYSFNEANEFKWPKGLREYISDIKRGKGELGLSYTSRYIGSLVGDIHRTLIYGGIFG